MGRLSWYSIVSKGKRGLSVSLTMLSLFLLERLLWPPLSMPSANLNGAVMLAWTLPLFLRGFHFADWSSFGHHKAIVGRDFLDFILIKPRRSCTLAHFSNYTPAVGLICNKYKPLSCNNYVTSSSYQTFSDEQSLMQ